MVIRKKIKPRSSLFHTENNIDHDMLSGKVLVTGANGFLGRALLAHLAVRGFQVRGALRRRPLDWNPSVDVSLIGELDGQTDWGEALTHVYAVVHCAARVHMLGDRGDSLYDQYRKVNVDGTLRLARQAAKEGIRRFVFISSIKVCGEETCLGNPFSADDIPAPKDSYGRSKYEAEIGLRQIADETGMEVVIVRPPLVYGPGVGANFQAMMAWLKKGIPLPLGAIDNRRSLVFIGNLVSLIGTCLAHPAAANQIFLVSDGEDLSTTELLRRTAIAMHRKARLFPLPVVLVRILALLSGKGEFAKRLCNNLQVDISKTKRLLGWTPVVSVDFALRETAQEFMACKHGQD